jgi:hypothetical protein
MALPGGHTPRLASLPWGSEHFDRVGDFDGDQGLRRVEAIVNFAIENQFTQVVGPTHLWNGPNDPWIRRDVRSMEAAENLISAGTSELQLIYSLAVPIGVLRDRAQRRAIISAVADMPCDGIWLKIENFGDDASGEKTAAYIEACREFHAFGLPIVADMVGGLPALAALAFGAVGGISHGVTIHQGFKAAGWRRPPNTGASPRLPARRVYVPQLDMMLKPEVARALINSSPRARGVFGCTDQHCCPHGISDMLGKPARHALYQRAREIERIAQTPPTSRESVYLDANVRPVSDNVARAAGLTALDADLRAKLLKKQTSVSTFRHAMTHLANADSSSSPSTAIAPPRRTARDQ